MTLVPYTRPSEFLPILQRLTDAARLRTPGMSVRWHPDPDRPRHQVLQVRLSRTGFHHVRGRTCWFEMSDGEFTDVWHRLTYILEEFHEASEYEMRLINTEVITGYHDGQPLHRQGDRVQEVRYDLTLPRPQPSRPPGTPRT
jgi:hypothetical protein